MESTRKDHNSRIYICIPIHNRIEYTMRCLNSIYRQTFKDFEIIVCDDGSSDNSSSIISKQFPGIIIEKGDGNLWWTGGMNMCIKKALSLCRKGDYIYTLNNDTELFTDTLEILIKTASQEKGAIIGTLNLFYSDPGKIENSAFIKGSSFLGGFRRFVAWGESLGERTGVRPVDGLTGKGVLIPVEVFDKTGLYNQDKLPHYHADLEFSWRAKRSGVPVCISYDARLLSHYELSGIGSVTSTPDLKEFIRSFFTIKSTHHFPSLLNFHQLVDGRLYPVHLIKSLAFMHLGFLKRWLKYKLSRKSNSE